MSRDTRGQCFRCRTRFASQREFGRHLRTCVMPLGLDFILHTFNATCGEPDICWPTDRPWHPRLQRHGMSSNVPRIAYAYSVALPVPIVVALAVHGPKPEGTVLTHTCDNIRCLNPSHLLWRTQQMNVQDAYDNGRRTMTPTHLAAMIAGRKMQAQRLREGGGAL